MLSRRSTSMTRDSSVASRVRSIASFASTSSNAAVVALGVAVERLEKLRLDTAHRFQELVLGRLDCCFYVAFRRGLVAVFHNDPLQLYGIYSLLDLHRQTTQAMVCPTKSYPIERMAPPSTCSVAPCAR